ncbi:hypothetical protein EMIHUDRAFT_363798, partial [Emiliania huxleyi CCMP1516]|uniref:DUF2828 domain-containing protein n=2 Tax=Emiliania huxleyi TaxID=2903 RepID=A0A0D3KCZ5_EMIH1
TTPCSSVSAFVAMMDSKTAGENGALEHSDAGSPLVALFFKLVRSLPDDSLASLTAAVPAEPASLADLTVLAFQTRATRGMGKGEKDLFFKMLAALPVEAATATLHLVPHFGYWKDYLLMQGVAGIDAAVKDKALSLLADQLLKDAAELEAAEKEARTPNLTLAGKYAPREGSAFDGLAKRLSTHLFGNKNEAASARKYRKLVASLNRALLTTEVLMAANRWAEIEFARVSSLCLQRSRKAFLNEALKGKLAPAQEETGNRHPEDEQR